MWTGHVYDHTGPIAAYKNIGGEGLNYKFETSCYLACGRGINVDGESLVVRETLSSRDANGKVLWIVYVDPVRISSNCG